MHPDFDKHRVEHVQHLEQRLQVALRMIADIQSNERWVPKVGVQMAGTVINVTLEYHGKRKTVQIPTELVRLTRIEDLTSQITQSFLNDLVFDGLRTAFEQPVAQVIHQINASANISESTLM